MRQLWKKFWLALFPDEDTYYKEYLIYFWKIKIVGKKKLAYYFLFHSFLYSITVGKTHWIKLINPYLEKPLFFFFWMLQHLILGRLECQFITTTELPPREIINRQRWVFSRDFWYRTILAHTHVLGANATSGNGCNQFHFETLPHSACNKSPHKHFFPPD